MFVCCIKKKCVIQVNQIWLYKERFSYHVISTFDFTFRFWDVVTGVAQFLFLFKLHFLHSCCCLCGFLALALLRLSGETSALSSLLLGFFCATPLSKIHRSAGGLKQSRDLRAEVSQANATNPSSRARVEARAQEILMSVQFDEEQQTRKCKQMLFECIDRV